jgi:hypothetical protein
MLTPRQPDRQGQRERCARWAKRHSADGGEVRLNWLAREAATGDAIAHFQAGVYWADPLAPTDASAKSGQPDSSTVVLQASLGYVVAYAAHRKGYAYEGLRHVLAMLRDQLGVREACAEIDSRNQASIALAGKLGMKPVRVSPGASLVQGLPADDVLFAMGLGAP